MTDEPKDDIVARLRNRPLRVSPEVGAGVCWAVAEAALRGEAAAEIEELRRQREHAMSGWRAELRKRHALLAGLPPAPLVAVERGNVEFVPPPDAAAEYEYGTLFVPITNKVSEAEQLRRQLAREAFRAGWNTLRNRLMTGEYKVSIKPGTGPTFNPPREPPSTLGDHAEPAVDTLELEILRGVTAPTLRDLLIKIARRLP
jgi:hypothetical protein